MILFSVRLSIHQLKVYTHGSRIWYKCPQLLSQCYMFLCFQSNIIPFIILVSHELIFFFLGFLSFFKILYFQNFHIFPILFYENYDFLCLHSFDIFFHYNHSLCRNVECPLLSFIKSHCICKFLNWLTLLHKFLFYLLSTQTQYW